MNQSNQHKYIDEIYKERDKFIIIGLTGYTGSGCSTVANLFSSEFEDLNAPIPKSNYYKGKDDRSYAILYDYAKSRWKKFTVITASSVILTFILENKFSEFKDFVLNEYKDEIEVKNKIEKEFSLFEKEYNELNKKRLELKALVEKDKENNLCKPDLFDFYFDKLPAFHKKIRDSFDRVNKGIYTKLWQKIGDNIRSSGEAFNSLFQPEKMFLFAQRLNMFIKILRKRTIDNDKVVHVVIDAFRNPFEIFYFKERYSSFYLLAISATEILVKQRLFKKGIDYKNFYEAKNNEESKKGEKYFISQDIPRCLELADIYFHNNGDNLADLSELAALIIRYYALILHPGLVAPTAQERCMQIAYNTKVNSGCISRQVGAVVTNKVFSVLSVGWNDAPKGQVPCNLCDINHLLTNNDKGAFSDFELKDKNYRTFVKSNFINDKEISRQRIVPFCFKDTYNGFKNDKNQVYTRALHAEENAFLQLVKNGIQLKDGGILFSTASPCELCSKKAFQLGIKMIYAIDSYPGISESQILNNGDKKNRPKLVFFEGAIGRAYTSLYQNMIPLKDENEMYYGINFKKGIKRISDLHSILKDIDDKKFEAIVSIIKNELEKNDY